MTTTTPVEWARQQRRKLLADGKEKFDLLRSDMGRARQEGKLTQDEYWWFVSTYVPHVQATVFGDGGEYDIRIHRRCRQLVLKIEQEGGSL